MNTTEEDRKRLLLSYMDMEPMIEVNGLQYEMSAYFDDEGVMFYCVNVRNQRLGAKVACLRSSWDQCTTGLTMAVLYANVLEICEESIKRGYEEQLGE